MLKLITRRRLNDPESFESNFLGLEPTVMEIYRDDWCSCKCYRPKSVQNLALERLNQWSTHVEYTIYIATKCRTHRWQPALEYRLDMQDFKHKVDNVNKLTQNAHTKLAINWNLSL